MRSAGDRACVALCHSGCAAADLTPGWKPHRPRALVYIGLVDAGAMIPKTGEIVVRRIVLHTPDEKLSGDFGIARIGWSEVLNLVLVKRCSFLNMEPAGIL